MPIPAWLRLLFGRNRWPVPLPVLLLGLAGLAACQPQRPPAEAAAPPVGHYQGSLGAAGSTQLRAALDIRHPRAGHYDAELTVPGAPGLSFVADTLLLAGNQLRLVRPARPGQTLALTLDGDFWRGTLVLDSQKTSVLLIRRGQPAPASYWVRRVALSPQTVLQFAPADESTAGPGIFMLPDSVGGLGAAGWADALARQGTVMQLPVANDRPAAGDTATASYLRFYLTFLRGHPGVDTAQVGLWLSGHQARALPAALADTAGHLPPLAFVVLLHPAALPTSDQAAWRRVGRKLRVLVLFHQTEARAATSWQVALAGRQRGRAVRRYPATDPGTALMQADVADWLRELKK